MNARPYFSHVIFNVQGYDIPHSELTEIMGVIPTRTYNAGDPLSPGNKVTHERTGWVIDSGRLDALDLGDQIDKMLVKVEPGIKKLRETIMRSWIDWDLELSVPIYMGEKAPSFFILPSTLDVLAGLKINLWIDLHPLWEAPPVRPRVGITSMLTHKNRVLVGVRKGSHCAGQRAFPGGHQEINRTWTETAVDEILEETGLTAQLTSHLQEPYLFVTDNLVEENKRYSTLWIPCVLPEGSDVDVNVRIDPLEPDKCEGWDWLDLHSLFTELLGKEDYTYGDIARQDPDQAIWLPIKKLLWHAQDLGLEWPDRLKNLTPPPRFWN